MAVARKLSLLAVLLAFSLFGFAQTVDLHPIHRVSEFNLDTIERGPDFVSRADTSPWSYSIVSGKIIPFNKDFDQVLSDSICAQRGHVSSGVESSTLMYCPSYIEDRDTVTYLVTPACNSVDFLCFRCLRMVSVPGKETRQVIWRKED